MTEFFPGTITPCTHAGTHTKNGEGPGSFVEKTTEDAHSLRDPSSFTRRVGWTQAGTFWEPVTRKETAGSQWCLVPEEHNIETTRG